MGKAGIYNKSSLGYIQTSVHYSLQLGIPETTARAPHYVCGQPFHEIKVPRHDW